MYEGTWQGAVVAVKEMKLQEASETQASDFLTEVTVLASLSHPNVIDFIGACTEPDHLAILLEFMPGGDASILLARDDVQITWERRLSWLLDVAKAMQYLHSRTPQIIHRDLKTENVLISADFLTAKGDEEKHVPRFCLNRGRFSDGLWVVTSQGGSVCGKLRHFIDWRSHTARGASKQPSWCTSRFSRFAASHG